ncbi:MAG: inorganic phosphate transporter, partial [Cryobacterium sp.]|nr:inorganic phosphate transporter [Cryobacterium sp.]
SPAQGFAAEASTTATILASTHLGFALSTTQVASGSIIGAGLGRNRRSVRWRVAGRIGVAWLVTLPCAATMAAIAELVARLGPWGIAADALAGAIVIVLMFRRSRRNPVNHTNVTGEIPVVRHTPSVVMPKVPPSIASAKPPKAAAVNNEIRNRDAS